MEDGERRTAKRSRFDQTEPEPKRASRFDRRSRSPPSRRSEGRDRSPLPRDEPSPPKSVADPAAAAAAAAAKINAQLQARRGIQHVDVPPIISGASAGGNAASPSNDAPASTVDGKMYVADGDYIQDIEVNDLRNRYMLIKASTLHMIKEDTGADVTTRGSYYPNKSMATAASPPLYLHITSTTKSGLEAAVAKLRELMQQELPQLVDERRFRRRDQEPVERDDRGRRKWPEERIPIDLEPIHGFNLRAQVVGHGGAYVKHIQQETGCRVQIKGRGSGYLEAATNQESDEEMFLHVTGPDPSMIEKAKELCLDLVDNVRQQYEEFKSRPPRFNDRGGYGDRRGDYHGDRGDRHRGGNHHNNSYQSYGGYGSEAGAANNQAAPGANSATNATDYAAQYAQYYNGADPYAQYGGYANYVALYQQYYGAQAAQAQAPGQAPGQASPPPPPSEAAPPPPPSPPAGSAPPPPPGSTGGYSAVPPPPGL